MRISLFHVPIPLVGPHRVPGKRVRIAPLVAWPGYPWKRTTQIPVKVWASEYGMSVPDLLDLKASSLWEAS